MILERTKKKNTFVNKLKSKVKADPDNAELRTEYAVSLSKAGKLTEAITQFAKAVELSADDLSIRLKYADALAKNKQNAKALAEYEETYTNPYIAAGLGYLDDVIEPADTRSQLIMALNNLSNKKQTLPPKKHGNIPL